MQTDIIYISNGNKFYKLQKKDKSKFSIKVNSFINSNSNLEIEKLKSCLKGMLFKKIRDKTKQDKAK